MTCPRCGCVTDTILYTDEAVPYACDECVLEDDDDLEDEDDD